MDKLTKEIRLVYREENSNSIAGFGNTDYFLACFTSRDSHAKNMFFDLQFFLEKKAVD